MRSLLFSVRHAGVISLAVAAALAASSVSAPSRATEARDEELPEPRFVQLDSLQLQDGGASALLTNGETAALTLRPDLQQAADRLLRKAHPLAGAAIAVDVASGKVLALSSYRRKGAPAGNPLTAPAPSASLFKLVTTAALFEHTDTDLTTRVCFSGGERSIERRHLEAPDGGDARCAPFRSALGHSWNAVYAQLATQRLMRDQLLQTAEQIGFNTALPSDVETTLGELEVPYNDLEFARTAAGFQGSSLTPLGAAQLTYGIALGGRAARLRLIEPGPDAAPGRDFYGRLMSPNAAWRLTRMMEVTVHGGTSLHAFTKEDGGSYLGGIRVAGKTGTLKQGEHAPTTSWFTSFAPSRKPEVVVTVMLQNGEVWREKANEVARDLLRYYFQGRRGVTTPFE